MSVEVGSFLNNPTQYLSMLRENDQRFKVIALKNLKGLVSIHWAEVSEYLSDIEELAENEQFSERQLASYIAALVYFHLEEYETALKMALESPDYFDINEKSQFMQCILTTCIDKYIRQRVQNYEAVKEDDKVKINQKEENVVQQLLEKCIQEKQYKYALGISIEARLLDKIELILTLDHQNGNNSNDLLNYLLDICMDVVTKRAFRIDVLKLIASYYQKHEMSPQDQINLVQCLFFLNDYESTSKILYNLIKQKTTENILLAYQIANDISDNDNQVFIKQIIDCFPIEQDEQLTKLQDDIKKLLKGQIRNQINLCFLKNNQHSDPQLILKLKDSVDVKKSVVHNSVIFSNSIFNIGTKNDSFLKENLDWVKKSSHWAKFSTTATLGVINKGDYSKAQEIFKEFLPGAPNVPNPNFYQNGGALYGLGLLHLGTINYDIINSLQSIIKDPTYQQNETIVHGAAMGIGLVGLASGDEALYSDLLEIVKLNQAVQGEAAGLSIGLIMAGTANPGVVQELCKIAEETDHEKIIRSVSQALALVMFGKEEQADTLIEQLLISKDPLIRYGGCMTVGLAYAGTANNQSIKRLLHYAAEDISDDVRRAAVISLAFVMFKQYEQVPKLLRLLGLSYNPHVRYGTALSIGIACAGTMFPEAISMLEPMLNDTVDFVRQAAFIGMALVMQQANNNLEPKLEKFKKNIEEVYTKKHEDILCKLGAILAAGILEAGGRNQVVKLASTYGFPKLGSCVGMMIFSHFWYWYPLINFFSLTLAPTAIIGVNENFQIPLSFEFQCNAKASLFEYPQLIKSEEKKGQGKTNTVVLSTTNKVRARAARKVKDGDQNEASMSRANSKLSPLQSKLSHQPESQIQQQESQQSEKMEVEEEKKEEPNSFILKNPSRVLDKQKKFITYIDNRYTPIINERKGGILFLIDSKPGEPDQYLQLINEKQTQQQQQPQQPPTDVPKQPLSGDVSQVDPPEDFIFDEQEQDKLIKDNNKNK